MRGKKRARWAAGIGLGCLALLALFARTPENDELQKLQATIQALHLDWTAGETSLSRLSDDEFRRMQGALPPAADSIQEPLWTCKRGLYPDHLDWRSQEQAMWLTSVKNQGNCGSCWAFATAALVEAMYRIEKNQADIDIDLSEQYMLSCCDSGNCEDGGSAYSLIKKIQSGGVTLESCFFYQARDIPCNPCAEWLLSRYFVSNYAYVCTQTSDPEAIIAALQAGPVLTRMEVYHDFKHYQSGIYELTPDQPHEGGHNVIIVGYDRSQQYWICKNSWGTGWGESGYFNIRWGQVGIGTWTFKISGLYAKKSAIGGW